MVNYIEGDLNAEGGKFGIVVSRFNDFITTHLADGAIATLIEHGVAEKDIDVVKVPGAFEIPMTAGKMCAANKYDAVICLGAVIRGATQHFYYVSGESSRGVGTLARESSIPVLFGILTTDNVEQAVERAGGKFGNKGAEAALAALEMVDLFKRI